MEKALTLALMALNRQVYGLIMNTFTDLLKKLELTALKKQVQQTQNMLLNRLRRLA